jgi:hypothetical protein
MAPILPVMKLAEVALKQIAKPVSKQLLEGALSYPKVTRFCVSIGQMLHYINVRVTRSAEGQSSSRRIFELPEDKAKDAGALFLGEVMVFSLTGVIVGWQIWVSQKASQDEILRKEQYEQLRLAEKHAEQVSRNLRLDQLEHNIETIWKVLDKIQNPDPYKKEDSKLLSSQDGIPRPPDTLSAMIATSMSSYV